MSVQNLGLTIAACSCFVAGNVLMFNDGSHHIRILVTASLVIGGAGPFLMQDNAMGAKVAGWMMSWVGILISTVALALYAGGW